MTQRLVRSILLVPAAVAVYAFVLHSVYVEVIVVNFAYTGYRYSTPTVYALLASWLLASLVAVALPARARSGVSVLLWILFLVVVAPVVLTLPYMGILDDRDGALFGAGLSIAFLLTVLISRRRAPAEPLRASVSPTTFWLIIGGFSAVTYGYVAFTIGISLDFLSLFDVYDQRSDYREALAESTILGYLVSNQANVVNPLLIAWGVTKRRWPLVIIVIVGQWALYSATGFKTVLFSIAAIALLLVLFKFDRRPRLLLMMWGASALVLLARFVDDLSGSIVLTSIFARRFLFTPARLSSIYYDWYSNNPLSLLANSILSPFITSPYEYGPARTIALHVTGAADSSLNANVYAAGYAEFGWVGLIGVGILLGIYLRIVDRAAAGLPAWFSAVVAVMPAITMANTSLQTAMLSHGLVAVILTLMLVPRVNAGGPLDPPATSRNGPRSGRHRPDRAAPHMPLRKK